MKDLIFVNKPESLSAMESLGIMLSGLGNEPDTPMMAGCRVSGPAAVTSSGHTLERAERAAWPAVAVSSLLIAVPPVPHPRLLVLARQPSHNVCQAQLIFTRHPGLSCSPVIAQ